MEKESISLRQLMGCMKNCYVEVTDKTTGDLAYDGFPSEIAGDNDILACEVTNITPAVIETKDGGINIGIVGLKISIFIERTA